VTTFNQLLMQEPCGAVWLIEASQDNFSTIVYRWSDKACRMGGQPFTPRISKLGRISKAFGLDGFPTQTTVDLILDNTDFALDGLIDPTQGAVEFTYRFRITLGLYDPTTFNSFTDEPTTQVMGIFGILDPPMRTDQAITLRLADDGIGLLNEFASSPTINEWIADGGSNANNNLLVSPANQPQAAIDFNSPLPIVFGPTAVGMLVQSGSDSANGGTLAAAGYSHAIVVCATTSSDAVNGNDVLQLGATYRPDCVLGGNGTPFPGAGMTFAIPQTVTVKNDPYGVPDGTYNIWSAQKSQAITKDGHSWKILWIAFSRNNYQTWANHTFSTFVAVVNGGNAAPISSPPIPLAPGTLDANRNSLLAITNFVVTGFPFSAQTVKTSQYQKGLDVITDIVSFYSAGSSANLDSTSFTTAATQNQVWVGGVIQPLQLPTGTNTPVGVKVQSLVAAALQPGQMRKVLGDIASSIGVDLFFTWAGTLGVSAGWFDFGSITAAKLTVKEPSAKGVTDRKPGQGERWTYYNRLYVQGPDGVVRGPYDNQAVINAIGVKIPRTIKAPWLLPDFSGGDPAAVYGPWQIGPRLDSTQRTLLSFSTEREALQLDLGGFFYFTWSRGSGVAAYSNALFHVEQISVDPETLQVDFEGVWVNDVTTINPYLLDDESHTLRVAAAGGRTASVSDSSTTVTFSSGSLVTDAVAAGDILVLQDSTEAAGTFHRNRALRIASITDATHLVISSSDLTFGGTVAVSAWTIYKGKTTYPTAISDPTNYPSGSAMYGKVTNSSGVYSDSSTGNQLEDG
jgi:hypothetical protein